MKVTKVVDQDIDEYITNRFTDVSNVGIIYICTLFKGPSSPSLKTKSIPFYLLLIIMFSCCKYDKDVNITYPFSLKLDGPFTIKDIINKNGIVYKKGIYKFDPLESDMYIFTLQSTKKDTIFVKIDSQTGLLLKNCRYYSHVKNDKYRLAVDFGVIDNGPTLIDTLLPFQTKQYYSSLALPDTGVIELYLWLNSGLIDSLNSKHESPTDKYYIKIFYPFFIFDVRERKPFRRDKELEFHKNIQK